MSFLLFFQVLPVDLAEISAYYPCFSKSKEIPMLQFEIPGGESYSVEHLVVDYNGTIAEDGELLKGVSELFYLLAEQVSLHVLTADTHGTVAQKVESLPVSLHIIGEDRQDVSKYNVIKDLGSRNVAAVGNGRNDVLMLQEAALGIALIQAEGCAGVLMAYADVVCTSIRDALNLFVYPTRLQATLRN
jgi:soluble P-type ATPase